MGEKLYNEMNVKVNLCDKAKLIKTNNIYYENNENDYLVIKKQTILLAAETMSYK